MSRAVTIVLLPFLLALALLPACQSSSSSGGDDDADTGTVSDSDTESDTDSEGPCQDNANCVQDYCDQVLIPSGIYPRGSDEHADGGPPDAFGGLDEYGDETMQHEVYLDAFCIDKYEVSIGRFKACHEADGCVGLAWSMDIHYPAEVRFTNDIDRYAAIFPTWSQAAEYCAWIGRRLCTEAEWERVANGPGPTKRTYPWGEEAPIAGVHGNFKGPDENYVAAVDSHPDGASVEGVLNLSGNVYEWVADWYAPYPEVSEDEYLETPAGPEAGEYKIGRGGCTFADSHYTTTERTTFDPNFDGG